MKSLSIPLLLLAILLATLHLFWPVMEWFVFKMSLANGWLHILAFGGLCGLGLYRLHHLPALPFNNPKLVIWPTVVWVSAGIIYLLNESQVGFNTLSAALFLLFLYGLSGCFIQQALWRRLFVPTSLLILVLPFEHYLDIYLGFPLRLLSADWAANILQHTGLPLLSTESILMIDNRAAIVDLDCSGIKSLWIGLIFYLLLTWIEHYRVSWRWIILGTVYVVLLVIANVTRITILVLLELVFDLPNLAAILHQSLGLLGFGIASTTIWWLLQKLMPTNKSSLKSNSEHEAAKKAQPNSPLLASVIALLMILIMNAFYQPQVIANTTTVIPPLELPKDYSLKRSSLNTQEKNFFASNHAVANKYHLSLDIEGKPVRAAIVLVWSRAWKTHHVPENCYLSQGFSIDDQGVWSLPNHTLRYLQLNQPKANGKLGSSRTASYWFQSSSKSTPDYSSRVIDNLFRPGEQWVMASILFEQTVTPQQITPFIQTLKQAIGEQFHDTQ